MLYRNFIKLAFAAIALSVASCNRESGSTAQSDALAPFYYADTQPKKCCTIIAHAGGAIDGNAYTNSREAIERNYAQGTRLFELDFNLTSDGHWVAAHDWSNWKNKTGFTGELPPTRDEFMSLPRTYKKASWSIEGEYSAIDMTGLEAFLSQHDDAVIVTDMKELEKFPDFVDTILASLKAEQLIFQAYSIENIELIKSRAPDAKIILTLYRNGYSPAFFSRLNDKTQDLIGLTAPIRWANIDSVREQLLKSGLPVYLHGAPANINSRGLQTDFAAKGISGFYLD